MPFDISFDNYEYEIKTNFLIFQLKIKLWVLNKTRFFSVSTDV